MNNDIHDLRSALEYLQHNGGEVEKCGDSLSAELAIANHYVANYAGVPASSVSRNEKIVIYENVDGHEIPVLLGVFGSRHNNRRLLCGGAGDYHAVVLNALQNRLPTEKINSPVCQEVVLTEDIDLCRILPVLTLTEHDAGPYITMGLVVATDPESGVTNASVHRLCVQGKDELSIAIYPGRHLGMLLDKARDAGKPLAVSINIGLDPAIYFASCLTEPLCSRSDSELEIAGGIRGAGVSVSNCTSVDEICISDAEIVIEGEITDAMVKENQHNPGGGSMPEFTGLQGLVPDGAMLPLIKVTAITHRKDPIYQTCIGPGLEQSELQSITPELATRLFLRREYPDLKVLDVVFNTSGGGLLMGVIQVAKQGEVDDARVVEAGMAVLKLAPPFKHIILVDEDVDPHSAEDLWWALTMRYQADIDTHTTDNDKPFLMDLTQLPVYRKSSSVPEKSAKALFDCTVPWRMKHVFKRPFFD